MFKQSVRERLLISGSRTKGGERWECSTWDRSVVRCWRPLLVVFLAKSGIGGPLNGRSQYMEVSWISPSAPSFEEISRLTSRSVLTWLLIFFGLPETLKARKDVAEEAATDTAPTTSGSHRPPLSRTSTREVIQTRSKKYLKVARMLLLDPLSVILYLRFMPVLLTVYYSAVTFGSLYVLNISIQYTFERQPYDFSTIIIGVLYLPNSLGYILASLIGGRWMDHIMKREAIKANRVDENGKLVFHPEDRMRENAWLGALMYPLAMIMYGWSAEKGVFWVVPVSSI